jgi:hypothetical protein
LTAIQSLAKSIYYMTHSQFYRKKRPENFSDSTTDAKVVLPREQLDYEISQISINQKHDNFEDLCRRLAEKLITPNLIPQVGPTGGGDGKTDSDTYPVSDFISDRWFVSGNRWGNDENWAFAFSAKEDWRSKVKSDVKKIVGTDRGYTKAFFFSNQKISSKNKKEVQDQHSKEIGINLTILDAEWILDKVYSNGLLNDVIETLNLSREYIEEKIVGPVDQERLSKLSVLEERINSTNRNSEVDFQLVDDCIESAVLSRMLELPKVEVLGRFDRAKRFSDKFDNVQLRIQMHYQLAWTLINWYDDYREFYDEYLIVKELVTKSYNIKNIELYYNLYSLLAGIPSSEDETNGVKIDHTNEDDDIFSFLNKCSLNTHKHTSSLLAKFFLSFTRIRKNIHDESVLCVELSALYGYFEISRAYLEIPFEQLKSLVDVYEKVLHDNQYYDHLIEIVAEIEAVRVSELSSAKRYLARAITKLENEHYRESLIYLGKASRKLAKEESQSIYYSCLMLISETYSKLSLYWASYNALISAASIYANVFLTKGRLDKKLLVSLEEILKNEILIGRLPIILCWYDFYLLAKHYSQEQDEIDENAELSVENLTDACLTTRLLNLPFEQYDSLKYLPDILIKHRLLISGDAVLFLLGHEKVIDIEENPMIYNKGNFSEFFNQAANQPLVNQLAYETNFLEKNEIQIETKVLGIQIRLETVAEHKLLILGEMILAYLESFLATSFEDIYPLAERIILKLDFGEVAIFSIISGEESSIFQIIINKQIELTVEDKHKLMGQIIMQVVPKNYMFRDPKTFFEKLYEKDEVHERLSIMLGHDNILTNLFSTKPKFFLDDWISKGRKLYDNLRKISPIATIENKPNESVQRLNVNLSIKNITHQQIKVVTIINSALWDEAYWQAFGSFLLPSGQFGLFLSFENGKAGRRIFEQWISQYGRQDINNTISITIIKGIDKKNPNSYKVLICKGIDRLAQTDGNLMSMAGRFHHMYPKDDTNLKLITSNFEKYKGYVLIPSEIDKHKTITPFHDLGIVKTHLKIIDAWKIGLHDTEAMAITKDDNPIIPDDVENAPVIELLEYKRDKN